MCVCSARCCPACCPQGFCWCWSGQISAQEEGVASAASRSVFLPPAVMLYSHQSAHSHNRINRGEAPQKHSPNLYHISQFLNGQTKKVTKPKVP